MEKEKNREGDDKKRRRDIKRERGMDVSDNVMLGGKEREKRVQMMREVILCLKK